MLRHIKSAPNSRKCYNSKCYGYFEVTDKQIKDYDCSFCSRNNCIECETLHPKMACVDYERSVLDGTDKEKIAEMKANLAPSRLKEHEYIKNKIVREYKQAKNLVMFVEKYPDKAESDIIWAVKQSTYPEIIDNLLAKTCELCTETYSQNHFFSMYHCDHSFCKICIKNYFEIQVSTILLFYYTIKNNL